MTRFILNLFRAINFGKISHQFFLLSMPLPFKPLDRVFRANKLGESWGSVHDALSLRSHAFELRPLAVLVDELGVRVMLVSSLLHRAVLYAWKYMPKRTTRSAHADTLPYEKVTRAQREQVYREVRKLERHRSLCPKLRSEENEETEKYFFNQVG